MMFVAIATILMPDISLPESFGFSQVIDAICNSFISVIGVLIAIQLFIKYKRGNRKRHIINEREAWELSEDKRKAKEEEEATKTK